MEDKTDLQKSCIAFANNPKIEQSVWRNCTSYSRDDKERIPTGFELKVGDCRIVITCGHRDYRNEWVFHCHELGFDTVQIGKDLTAEQAAIKAYNTCKEKAHSIYNSFLNL